MIGGIEEVVENLVVTDLDGADQVLPIDLEAAPGRREDESGGRDQSFLSRNHGGEQRGGAHRVLLRSA